MVDSKVEKLAKLCVHYSVNVKPKERVVIRELSELAFPLINEIYKECLLCDAYPLVMLTPHVKYTPFAYTFYKYAKEHQLEFVSPVDKFVLENTDVRITVACFPYPKELTNIDPSKIKMHAASREELMKIFMKRMAKENSNG